MGSLNRGCRLVVGRRKWWRRRDCDTDNDVFDSKDKLVHACCRYGKNGGKRAERSTMSSIGARERCVLVAFLRKWRYTWACGMAGMCSA